MVLLKKLIKVIVWELEFVILSIGSKIFIILSIFFFRRVGISGVMIFVIVLINFLSIEFFFCDENFLVVFLKWFKVKKVL